MEKITKEEFYTKAICVCSLKEKQINSICELMFDNGEFASNGKKFVGLVNGRPTIGTHICGIINIVFADTDIYEDKEWFQAISHRICRCDYERVTSFHRFYDIFMRFSPYTRAICLKFYK